MNLPKKRREGGGVMNIKCVRVPECLPLLQ